MGDSGGVDVDDGPPSPGKTGARDALAAYTKVTLRALNPKRPKP